MTKRMPVKKQPHTAVRRCTMCHKLFEYTTYRGAPPAFCTPKCKEDSLTSPTRRCITDGIPFVRKGNPYGAFYCSEECQRLHPCQLCGKPTKEVFCSAEHMMQAFPPPYTCVVDGRSFLPTPEFLKTVRSLRGPQKYCSPECYDKRSSPNQPNDTPRNARDKFDYKLEVAARVDFELGEPYGLPIRRNGSPWIGVTPVVPLKKLHYMSQNTIMFWDYIFNSTPYLDGLTAHQYNAFLFEFVCRRKINSFSFAVQEGWSLWPYIVEYTDSRYDPRLFERIVMNYLHDRRSLMKHKGAMDKEALEHTIRLCVDAFKVKVGMSVEIKTTPKLDGFAAKWITPIIAGPTAPYKNPRPDPDHPDRPAYLSKIQIETLRYFGSISELHVEPWKTYLDPMTLHEFSELESSSSGIFKTAEIMNKERKKPWPWGPNRYNDFLNKPWRDPIQEMIDEIMFTANYNLPEPSPIDTSDKKAKRK